MNTFLSEAEICGSVRGWITHGKALCVDDVLIVNLSRRCYLICSRLPSCLIKAGALLPGFLRVHVPMTPRARSPRLTKHFVAKCWCPEREKTKSADRDRDRGITESSDKSILFNCTTQVVWLDYFRRMCDSQDLFLVVCDWPSEAWNFECFLD
jgi:hypothetical protein